ncbi:MAG: AAA family ATPase [bacterium]
MDKIIGQTEAISSLKNLLRRRDIPPLIFYGKSGIGKRMAAIAFAGAINCDDNGCVFCSSCNSLKNHPDIREIKDEQGYIKIDPIREIIKEANLKPTYKKRVYIIDNAHLLTPAASSCLLKTLEEATPLFILITSSINSLLPTIRSRCFKIRFKPLSLNSFKSLGIEDEMLVEMSGGSMEKILNYSKININEEKKALSLWVSSLKTKSPFLLIEELVKMYERFPHTLELLLFIFKKNGFYFMIDKVLEAKEALKANVHRRLALEKMVFGITND